MTTLLVVLSLLVSLRSVITNELLISDIGKQSFLHGAGNAALVGGQTLSFIPDFQFGKDWTGLTLEFWQRMNIPVHYRRQTGIVISVVQLGEQPGTANEIISISDSVGAQWFDRPVVESGMENYETDGEWHHIVFVFQEPFVAWYIDGIKTGVDQSHERFRMARPISAAATRPTCILLGCEQEHFYAGYKQCIGSVALDNFRLWSKALTLPEITTVYNKVLPPQTPDLVAQYTFDEVNQDASRSPHFMSSGENSWPWYQQDKHTLTPAYVEQVQQRANEECTLSAFVNSSAPIFSIQPTMRLHLASSGVVHIPVLLDGQQGGNVSVADSLKHQVNEVTVVDPPHQGSLQTYRSSVLYHFQTDSDDEKCMVWRTTNDGPPSFVPKSVDVNECIDDLNWATHFQLRVVVSRYQPQPELPFEWNQHVLVTSEDSAQTQQLVLLLNVTIFRNSPPIVENVTLIMVEDEDHSSTSFPVRDADYDFWKLVIFTLPLRGHLKYRENDVVFHTITSDQLPFTLPNTGSELVFRPHPNEANEVLYASFVYAAKDPAHMSKPATAFVKVEAINDLPDWDESIGQHRTLIINEGTSAKFNPTFHDADNEFGWFIIQKEVQNGHLSVYNWRSLEQHRVFSVRSEVQMRFSFPTAVVGVSSEDPEGAFGKAGLLPSKSQFYTMLNNSCYEKETANFTHFNVWYPLTAQSCSVVTDENRDPDLQEVHQTLYPTVEYHEWMHFKFQPMVATLLIVAYIEGFDSVARVSAKHDYDGKWFGIGYFSDIHKKTERDELSCQVVKYPLCTTSFTITEIKIDLRNCYPSWFGIDSVALQGYDRPASNVFIKGSEVTFTPHENFNGEENIELQLTDCPNDATRTTIRPYVYNIKVLPVNDLPVLQAPDDVLQIPTVDNVGENIISVEVNDIEDLDSSTIVHVETSPAMPPTSATSTDELDLAAYTLPISKMKWSLASLPTNGNAQDKQGEEVTTTTDSFGGVYVNPTTGKGRLFIRYKPKEEHQYDCKTEKEWDYTPFDTFQLYVTDSEGARSAPIKVVIVRLTCKACPKRHAITSAGGNSTVLTCVPCSGLQELDDVGVCRLQGWVLPVFIGGGLTVVVVILLLGLCLVKNCLKAAFHKKKHHKSQRELKRFMGIAEAIATYDWPALEWLNEIASPTWQEAVFVKIARTIRKLQPFLPCTLNGVTTIEGGSTRDDLTYTTFEYPTDRPLLSQHSTLLLKRPATLSSEATAPITDATFTTQPDPHSSLPNQIDDNARNSGSTQTTNRKAINEVGTSPRCETDVPHVGCVSEILSEPKVQLYPMFTTVMKVDAWTNQPEFDTAIKITNTLTDLVNTVCGSHFGTLVRIDGDTLLVAFGLNHIEPKSTNPALATAPHYGYALHACYCAQLMHDRLPHMKHADDLNFRCCIASGPVRVGNLGSEKTLHLNIVGVVQDNDPMHEVNSLHTLNSEIRVPILISDKTWSIVETFDATKYITTSRFITRLRHSKMGKQHPTETNCVSLNVYELAVNEVEAIAFKSQARFNWEDDMKNNNYNNCKNNIALGCSTSPHLKNFLTSIVDISQRLTSEIEFAVGGAIYLQPVEPPVPATNNFASSPATISKSTLKKNPRDSSGTDGQIDFTPTTTTSSIGPSSNILGLSSTSHVGMDSTLLPTHPPPLPPLPQRPRSVTPSTEPLDEEEEEEITVATGNGGVPTTTITPPDEKEEEEEEIPVATGNGGVPTTTITPPDETNRTVLVVRPPNDESNRNSGLSDPDHQSAVESEQTPNVGDSATGPAGRPTAPPSYPPPESPVDKTANSRDFNEPNDKQPPATAPPPKPKKKKKKKVKEPQVVYMVEDK